MCSYFMKTSGNFYFFILILCIFSIVIWNTICILYCFSYLLLLTLFEFFGIFFQKILAALDYFLVRLKKLNCFLKLFHFFSFEKFLSNFFWIFKFFHFLIVNRRKRFEKIVQIYLIEKFLTAILLTISDIIV